MAVLFEGSCIGKAVKPEFGADQNGKPKVRWEMEVTDGEHVGKRAQYSGKMDAENIKWTKRDMISIGWKGKDVRTFVDDVLAAQLVVPFEAQIASYESPSTGKTSTWTAAKMTGALPLAQVSSDKIADVNRWFAEAEDMSAPPTSNGHREEAPPPDDSDIPF